MSPSPRAESGEGSTSRDAFDAARAEAFGARVTSILNDGALSLMLSIGHRAGIFDAMRSLGEASCEDLARRAGLNERYVREWLGALVTGGIVLHDSRKATFALPAEHAAVLTRAARPNNLAATSQWIPLLARVEDEVLHCFEHGGGVPYAAYERFHEVMAEESEQGVLGALRDAILPLVPGLPDALERGIEVLDVGCGSGRAMVHLARAYPRSRFAGLDLSRPAIETARREASECGLANVGFEVRDVVEMREREAYDLVTAFDAIHDQARPDAALQRIAAALRPGGVFLMQEIRATSHVEKDAELPLAPFLYTVSCLHCLTVSLADDGAGLGAMWGAEAAARMLTEAGFVRIELRTIPRDAVNQYFIAHRPA